MDQRIPRIDRSNEDGGCWTCLRWKRTCDGTVPICKNCRESGLKCRGFAVRLQWPSNVASTAKSKTRRGKRTARCPSPAQRVLGVESSPSEQRPGLSVGLSSLALPHEDSFFMQHFLRNFARVALAIDYNNNGYRSLLPMAMTESGLMSALLAVAASHYGRWQRTTETASRRYRRHALEALQTRFSQPDLIQSPVTLACMLALVTYEVFSGSSRWRGHHEAIRGWVRARGDCSNLDPFLKAWICLIDTQSALNIGVPAMPEIRQWLADEQMPAGTEDSIDALFGCSSKLPQLMWEASQLYAASKDGQTPWELVCDRVDRLQEQIYSTRLSMDSNPRVHILCQQTAESLFTTVDLDEDELRRRMIATAEIFRHACHIYVYRLVHPPSEGLSPPMMDSLQTALELLTLVPDALGPGANLGWCLVVLGAEVDLNDQRDYIRLRWPHLDLLGIDNYKNAQMIVEEVWNQRDRVNHGGAIPGRWQEVMQHLGQTQILI
ncbi:Zn(2)-C6 fungal-type DNA-binding domain protein [Pleurostoma richardsiae]|uniref:Zn(2)-C6 fungal-type DNA-binding domain protein n=1 Tax=Pleurostoma richardsiae TaxID=41990 RepID=A0AA38VL32_9PEZI|nr:Zn(2)-C6 fungal-type DNA-binding domain protein [Pleurostoma richardsiae]